MGTSFWWLNQTQCPHKKSFISRRILYFKLWYVHFKPWYVHFKPWYVYFKPWYIHFKPWYIKACRGFKKNREQENCLRRSMPMLYRPKAYNSSNVSTHSLPKAFSLAFRSVDTYI